MALSLLLAGCGAEEEEAKEGFVEMLEDLTSSFSNRSSALLSDFVMVQTDRYSKDYIDDYDLSGLASVGYVDQDQAVVAKSDAYKVLVCAGEGSNCNYNILNRGKGSEIWSKVSEGCTVSHLASLFDDPTYVYGDDVSQTDTTSALAKQNTVLCDPQGNKLKNSKGGTYTVRSLIKGCVTKLKAKSYAQEWDKASCNISTLPGAVAYARANEYSCVVYFTFRIDNRETGPSIDFYGPNAESLEKLTGEIYKDYGDSLKDLHSADCSKANDDYKKEVAKAADKLNMNIMVVSLCTVSPGKSVMSHNTPTGKSGYWFKDNKKLHLTSADFSEYKNSNGVYSIYSEMTKLLDTLIKSAYEGVLPNAEDITSEVVTGACDHRAYTDLKDIIESKIGNSSLESVTIEIPQPANSTGHYKYDGDFVFTGTNKPAKVKTCDKCGVKLYDVEVKKRTVTYSIQFQYNSKTVTGTINIVPQQ